MRKHLTAQRGAPRPPEAVHPHKKPAGVEAVPKTPKQPHPAGIILGTLQSMNIAISGATGFIAQRLVKYLTQRGNTIVPLRRELFEIENFALLISAIKNCDTVINLAGAPILKRWTPRYREEILRSRVITTRLLVQAINRLNSPKTLISASAVGYYPSAGCYDESSNVENYSFLAYVCRLWEREARRLNCSSRLVIARFGVVLSHSGGGALESMTSTHRFGFLPCVGSPERPMSWVDREDLVRALEFISQHESIDGVVNIVSPHFTLQRDFLVAAQCYYNTRFIMPVSSMLVYLLYGRAAEVITNSPCVSSQKLEREGFRFRSKSIYDFFAGHTK